MVEDDRPILGSHVVALAVQRGGVVDVEENSQKVRVAQSLRVESNTNDFRVARVPRANVLVGRVDLGPAGVARLDRDDAFQLLENRLGAPKASTSERRLLD